MDFKFPNSFSHVKKLLDLFSILSLQSLFMNSVMKSKLSIVIQVDL